MLVPVRLREGHALHRATYHDSPHVRPMGGNLNIYALRKDGSEFPAEISLSYLDTDDGLLISTAIRDVTDRKRTEHALDERLRFELLISAIAATLSEVAPDELDTGINDGLRQIGHFFDMDRCYFNQISVDGSEFRVTHLWHAEDLGDEEAIKLKRFEFYREFPWFATKMLARESIFVSRLDELPPEATAERQYCLGAGIVSFATVPLVVEESVLGNLSIIKSAPMTWSEDIPPRVELLCDIFASTLLRHRKEAELRNAHQEVERLSERLQAENLRLAEEIVERKETETTLRASHERLRLSPPCSCRRRKRRANASPASCTTTQRSGWRLSGSIPSRPYGSSIHHQRGPGGSYEMFRRSSASSPRIFTSFPDGSTPRCSTMSGSSTPCARNVTGSRSGMIPRLISSPAASQTRYRRILR